MRQHLAKEFCFGGDFDVVNNWHAPQKHPLWTLPDGFAWPFSHTHTRWDTKGSGGLVRKR